PFKTGRTWGFEHYGVVPDVLTLGKGIGGGLPIGAAGTRRELADRARGREVGIPGAGAVAGDPVGGAVAKRGVEVPSAGHDAARARTMGHYLMERLRLLADRYEILGDVRGKGLYIGVEVVKDAIGRERDGALMHRIRWNALEHGLLLAGSGNVLKMFPALIITREEIDEGIQRLERAVRRALDGYPRGVERFTTTSVT